jgi:ribonuclease P/MRP protein subunit RPP1
MSYYACGLLALPEGSDSASRLALAALKLGYKGVIFANSNGKDKIFRPEAAYKIKGIEVVWGTKIVAKDPRALRSKISALREKYELLTVHASGDIINKAACEDPKVDMLALTGDGRSGLNIATARAARETQVVIGIDLLPMMRLRGTARQKWLEAFSHNLEMARKFELPIALTMGVGSHLDLHAPREILALAELAGMTPEEAKGALSLPARLVRWNRRRWAGPGVELL